MPKTRKFCAPVALPFTSSGLAFAVDIDDIRAALAWTSSSGGDAAISVALAAASEPLVPGLRIAKGR